MAKYKLFYAPSAIKNLQKLPLKIVDAVANFCEGPLIENPQRVGKALRGDFEGFHTAKRGSYRVIYKIDDDRVIVEVTYIEHRSSVYRNR
jgi:mRNA-degrading endonuclease RelE of RelBE toxin-antitoxin system